MNDTSNLQVYCRTKLISLYTKLKGLKLRIIFFIGQAFISLKNQIAALMEV